MPLDRRLLEILACPEDKGPLWYFASDNFLYNPRLKRRYRVEEDIPVMLVEEATTLSAEEHQRLVARAKAEGLDPSTS